MTNLAYLLLIQISSCVEILDLARKAGLEQRRIKVGYRAGTAHACFRVLPQCGNIVTYGRNCTKACHYNSSMFHYETKELYKKVLRGITC